MSDEPNYIGPGRYRHYKGGEYAVLGLALQEDSLVKPGELGQHGMGCGPTCDRRHDDFPGITFVIYKPLTLGSLLETRAEQFWARELSDFNQQVHPADSGQDGFVRRFTWIGPFTDTIPYD